MRAKHRRLLMIRHLTLALALVAAAPALAEMQGNLPTPVQKLPAYPPAVCVAPNWATVPCASRAPKPLAVKCLKPDGTEEPCESRGSSPADPAVLEDTHFEWECDVRATIIFGNAPPQITNMARHNFEWKWGDLYLDNRRCVLKSKWVAGDKPKNRSLL